MEMNEIKKDSIDEAGDGLRSGIMNENAIPKANNIFVIGKFLRDTYYPGLSIDEINERIEILEDKGIIVEDVVKMIKDGQLDLNKSIDEIKKLDLNKEKNDEEITM